MNQQNQPQSIKNISETFLEYRSSFIRKIIPILSNILFNLIVSASFLLASELIFHLISWTSTDLRTRIEFVSWLLDGAQVVSNVATIGIFIISTLSDFRTQWKLINELGDNNG